MSWGVRLGDTEALFTHVAAPVMTRLRQPERRVLDTLVDAGVARSRSDALAWSVRLVGEHADEWLGQLRDAMAEVDKLRGEGPALCNWLARRLDQRPVAVGLRGEKLGLGRTSPGSGPRGGCHCPGWRP